MTEDMEAAVEKLRAAFDAFNRDDLESAGEWVAQDVEIGRTPFIDPPGRGREAFLAFSRPDMFERQTIELHATEVHGNVILADLTFHAVGKGSGVEVSQANYQLFTFRDGRFAKWEVFFDRNEAEAALASN
jgi:ketosteroid isomerase-like protein